MRVDQVVRANQRRERAIALIEHARHAVNELLHTELMDAAEVLEPSELNHLKRQFERAEELLRNMQTQTVVDLEEQFV